MRTCSPLAIAGQPSCWAGVGPAKARSNHARVSGAKAASGSGRPIGPGYYRAMAQPLWFTDDPAACQLLADDPFALLVGFAIDQQVPVQKAFAGPYVLKQRVGTLDPKRLAATDLEPAFREKPAIHRFPGAMASRVRELAAVVAEEYGGDASRIWREANDTEDLEKRLSSL